MSRRIIMTSYLTVPARKDGKVRYIELFQGQELQCYARKGNLLLLQAGWVVLPSNALRPHVTARDFVIAWQTSNNPEEVAAKLGRPVRKVLAWERRCRREGVNLKPMCEA